MNNLKIDALEQGLQKNDYASVKEYIKESTERLRLAAYNNDLAGLKKEYDTLQLRLVSNISEKIFTKNIDFLFGRYIGIFDAIYEFIAIAKEKKKIIADIDTYNIKQIPHINDIIKTIYNNPGVQHIDLAQEIKIDKSTLTGIMNRLQKSGAVTYSKPGKFKFYYLSDTGKAYYEENRKSIEASLDTDTIIKQLLLNISKEKNPDTYVSYIIKCIQEQRKKDLHSERDKLSIIGNPALENIKPENSMTRNYKLRFFSNSCDRTCLGLYSAVNYNFGKCCEN